MFGDHRAAAETEQPRCPGNGVRLLDLLIALTIAKTEILDNDRAEGQETGENAVVAEESIGPASQTQIEDITDMEYYRDSDHQGMSWHTMEPWWLHENFAWLSDFDNLESGQVADSTYDAWQHG
jgi:hypothetical protein